MKKQMMLVAVPVIMLCATLNAQQQVPEPGAEVVKERYERETIYLSGNSQAYLKNEKRKRVGLFAGKIKHEFDSCSIESKSEMAVCAARKKRGSILIGAGAVAVVGSFFVMPVVIGPAIIGLGAIGFPAYILGALDLHSAQNHLHRAVWLRNRDVISTGKS